MVMPSRETDRRGFYRMAVDAPVTYRSADGARQGRGRCRNLSGSGILFYCDEALPVGSRWQITVASASPQVAPLEACIEVLRAEPLEGGQCYEIAGQMC